LPALDFSFCFRKGDVGGDRGFDAALAFLTCAVVVSELDGESRKNNMPTHNTAPTMIVSGLIRRNRTGPMAALGVLNSMFWCRRSAYVDLSDQDGQFVLHEPDFSPLGEYRKSTVFFPSGGVAREELRRWDYMVEEDDAFEQYGAVGTVPWLEKGGSEAEVLERA
jgi:hypothetical protein